MSASMIELEDGRYMVIVTVYGADSEFNTYDDKEVAELVCKGLNAEYGDMYRRWTVRYKGVTGKVDEISTADFIAAWDVYFAVVDRAQTVAAGIIDNNSGDMFQRFGEWA